MQFINRSDAGQRLANLLTPYEGKNVVVYGLPRGGVVTASEIARHLRAPLDVIITRKIGHPNSPEYAIGAVAANGHRVFNSTEVSLIDPAYIKDEIKRQKEEAKRRRTLYLNKKKPISARGKIAIIVDDGVATGLTMRAAIKEIRHQKPQKIIVAVPVVAADIADTIRSEADALVALEIAEFFQGAVGAYYEEFSQVEDDEVVELLEKERRNA